jgi:hypothetical protein
MMIWIHIHDDPPLIIVIITRSCRLTAVVNAAPVMTVKSGKWHDYLSFRKHGCHKLTFPLSFTITAKRKRRPFTSKLILNCVAVVRKRTILTERPPLVGEVSVKFAGRGCCVISAIKSHGRYNLGFLNPSRYVFIQVAPQLSNIYIIILKSSCRPTPSKTQNVMTLFNPSFHTVSLIS